jgi:hypothetical protein
VITDSTITQRQLKALATTEKKRQHKEFHDECNQWGSFLGKYKPHSLIEKICQFGLVNWEAPIIDTKVDKSLNTMISKLVPPVKEQQKRTDEFHRETKAIVIETEAELTAVQKSCGDLQKKIKALQETPDAAHVEEVFAYNDLLMLRVVKNARTMVDLKETERKHVEGLVKSGMEVRFEN